MIGEDYGACWKQDMILFVVRDRGVLYSHSCAFCWKSGEIQEDKPGIAEGQIREMKIV